jgi:AP2-like factor, ANT lineage
MTNNNGGNDTNAAASGWLGFSLSPYMDEHQLQQQQQHGLFFPSVTAASAASYGLGGGVATSASPYYTPQLASMPLKSDGSLCIMEALRRSDQQDQHGTYVRHIHTELMASRRPVGCCRR